MDFSIPPTAMGGPRDYKRDVSDSESEDEKFAIPDSNGASLRLSPPPKAWERPEVKVKVETMYDGAAANPQQAMAAMGEFDESNIVSERQHGRVKKENRVEVEMKVKVEGDMDLDMGGEMKGPSAPARKRKPTKKSRLRRLNNTSTVCPAEKVAGAVTQAARMAEKKARREHNLHKEASRRARELEIAVDNGSFEGLSKSAIRRINNLKGDEITKMFALAGSMSLEAKLPTTEPSVVEPSWAEPLADEIRRQRVAGELQPFLGEPSAVEPPTNESFTAEHSADELLRQRVARELQTFLAEGGKQAWDDRVISQFQGAENTETPLAERGLPSNTPTGPRQPNWIFSHQDSMEMTATTSKDRAAKLLDKKRKRLIRKEQKAAKGRAGIPTENGDFESDSAIRARVTLELDLALSGGKIEYTNNGEKKRMGRWRKAWLSKDPSVPRPEFHKMLAQALEQEMRRTDGRIRRAAKKERNQHKIPKRYTKFKFSRVTVKDLGKCKVHEKTDMALENDGAVSSAFSQMELGEEHDAN